MSILSQQKQSVNTDFPNLRPSLDLRFALAKKLDPRITFTRGSTGTYFGPDGIMRTADVNEPRFDHDPVTGQSLGLLVEESRINSLLYSQDFSNAVWNTSGLSLSLSFNNIIGLDGTTSASTFTAVSTGPNYIYQNFTCTASTTYTFSFYVKLGTLPASSYKIAVYNNTGASFIASDVVPTQTLSSNSWTRVSYTFTTPVGCVSARVYPYRNVVFAQNNGTFYVWGSQIETGSFPTSYIPTTTSTVTRSVDVASMTGINLSSWYNQSEGTFFTDVKSSSGFIAVNACPFAIFGAANQIVLGNYHTLSSAWLFRNSVGTNNAFFAVNMSTTQNRKSVATYRTGTADYYTAAFAGSNLRNSTANTSSANPKTGTLRTDQISFDLNPNKSGLVPLNGTISRLTYYPIQLTNQQLINLTS